MATLIGFLLDNIFIVIIVIGFLLSLFRSAGKTNRMPDFGGGGRTGPAPGAPGQQPRAERESTSMKRMESSYPSRPETESTITYPIRYDRVPETPLAGGQSENLVRERRHHELRERRRAQETAPKRTESTWLAEPGTQQAGAEEIRRAVLWAEILGPPRARRPYR